ncbi:GGDEF domain-containing protein [Dactylosporangium aurantiacum]|uniref:GGDEF domain-containing protein n=1 Tax=Dactylosporangium aurantiacum TaxID=35754 RepID=A0A9Q9IHY4_9ACTN|nr:GGDEF domain-containing protein [Dactylosporangium aurantiacum]MDG6108976.1 GGDEF domain-containing protein [Dactylosporangium aurantiacum]UWZ56519.1 GGDEF domain-containing protein [Dactylosporangium aurantiacum]
MTAIMRRPAPWQVWLGCGALMIVVYYVLPAGGSGRGFLYPALSASCTLMVVAGIRRNRPVRPSVWYCVAAGLGMWSTGDFVFAYLYYVRGDTTFPSYADACYLGAIPVFAAGVFILIKGRVSRRDRAGLQDALIISTGLALLTWTFMMRPIAEDHSVGLLARLVSLAAPAGDLLLIAMLLRLVASPGGRSASYRFLIGGFAFTLGTDVLYSVVNTVAVYEGGAMDAGWMTSYLMFGAAALHPSMRSLSEVAPDRAERFHRQRIGVLAATSLLAPATLVYDGLTDPTDVDWKAISAGSVVLFLLVVARMSGLVAQVRDQAAQLEALAHNDGLTGVPNRRAWDLELHRETMKARRGGTEICVALLDLDHFKRFNDTHGHQAGDRLLKEASAAWRALLRPGDVLARYGGEEFGVLLVGASTLEAVRVLDRLREVTPQGQTFSAGLVRWDGAESTDEVVGRADEALYHAKHDGRDRVHLSDPIRTTRDTRILA